jgi:hypothetical protein
MYTAAAFARPADRLVSAIRVEKTNDLRETRIFILCIPSYLSDAYLCGMKKNADKNSANETTYIGIIVRIAISYVTKSC